MEQGASEIIREQEAKLKRSREQRKMKMEQWNFVKKERAPKNGREQGEWGKMWKGAGRTDRPNRASITIQGNGNLYWDLRIGFVTMGSVQSCSIFHNPYIISSQFVQLSVVIWSRHYIVLVQAPSSDRWAMNTQRLIDLLYVFSTIVLPVGISSVVNVKVDLFAKMECCKSIIPAGNDKVWLKLPL